MQPHEIIPLDPDEFLAALEYASMVAENEFLEELPILKSTLAIQGRILRFANVPENRFGFAVMRFFRGRKHDKGWSFMTRFSAMKNVMRRMRHETAMQPYVKEIANGFEFHKAVFEVAATQELSPAFDFCPESFARSVKEIAKRLDAEKSSASQRAVAQSTEL